MRGSLDSLIKLVVAPNFGHSVSHVSSWCQTSFPGTSSPLTRSQLVQTSRAKLTVHSGLWHCLTAWVTWPEPCLQSELDPLDVPVSQQGSRWYREGLKLAQPLHGCREGLFVSSRRYQSFPCMRASHQARTKHRSLPMQILPSTRGYAVSQGCDDKARQTHSCCLLIKVWVV